MTPRTRLSAIAVVLVLSAIYAFLVARSPAAARTVALGYICLLLTIIVLIQCWRKPPHG